MMFGGQVYPGIIGFLDQVTIFPFGAGKAGGIPTSAHGIRMYIIALRIIFHYPVAIYTIHTCHPLFILIGGVTLKFTGYFYLAL
jgi:hypothetical protein